MSGRAVVVRKYKSRRWSIEKPEEEVARKGSPELIHWALCKKLRMSSAEIGSIASSL